MTVAICIKCGERKHGALTMCRNCRFDPIDTKDRAKSMIVTDHFLTIEELENIGADIREGKEVNYPQHAIDEFIELIEEQDAMAVPGFIKYAIFVVLIAVVIGVIWLFT